MKLIFGVLDRYELYPQFKAYYESQGVTQFFSVSYGPELEGVDKSFRNTKLFSPAEDASFHNKIIRDYVDENEWCIVADLDEFYSVPGLTLAKAIQEAERSGANFIQGTFYDRVTADGHFPAHLTDNIWEQFPLSVNATQVITGGYTKKICALRGDMRVMAGHHDIDEEESEELKPGKNLARVYHFKWWGENHLWFNDRTQNDDMWRKENERLTQHLTEHGRINISMLTKLE